MSAAKRRNEPAMVFAPLGGVGEIGMNLALYGFGPEGDRQWLIVDCGVTFAGPHLPGIDLIMPDIRFVEAEAAAGKVVGLVLTHAHEDHYGALLDLWPMFECPVYATRFAKAMVAAKAQGNGFTEVPPITEVSAGKPFSVGPFTLEMVPMAHSIPESCGVLISTPLGNVLHTGDWKLDAQPVGGWATDEARLREIGENVHPLALVGDSTNATREGDSPSESEVAASLEKLIAEAKNRVAVTIFASNVGRMISIAKAAQAAGRQIVASGRAVHRISTIARELGMMEGVDDFLDQDAFEHIPRDKVALLCTGSQGEARAAMARIARREHPAIELARGDTVIFSSRPIPGNEREIIDIQNMLIDQGVELITDRDALVHVSGHPRRHELRSLYDWVKPDLLVPVHGEALHLGEHAELAGDTGIAPVLTARNGDLVSLFPKAEVLKGEIPSGRLYLDGDILCEPEASGVAQRRRLSYGGMVMVSLCVDGGGRLAAGPDIRIEGLPETDDPDADFEKIAEKAVMATLKSMPAKRRRNADALAESIRRAVRSEVGQAWGNRPNVTVIAHEV